MIPGGGDEIGPRAPWIVCSLLFLPLIINSVYVKGDYGTVEGGGAILFILWNAHGFPPHKNFPDWLGLKVLEVHIGWKFPCTFVGLADKAL